jgi:erythromycin esterase-like protein
MGNLGSAADLIQDNTADIKEILSNADEKITSAVGSGFNGGFFSENNAARIAGDGAAFAGMDSKNIHEFARAVTTYKQRAYEVLNKFNTQEGPILNALKGDVATAVQQFFSDAKKLSEAYVNAIEVESKRVMEANKNWLETTKKLSGDIDIDSGALAGAAGSIKLD